MRFTVSLSGKTLYSFMRQAGYAPSLSQTKSNEFVFQRPGGNIYPKFHVYATQANGTATLNLHLDQKKPSYKGSAAHGGEYDGQLVEQEIERIKNLT